METFLYLIAGIAMGSIALTIGKLVFDYKSFLSAKILIAILFCVVCYILTQVLTEPVALMFVLEIFSASIPPLFWLFAISFFSTQDGGLKLTKTHFALFGVCTIFSISLCSYIHSGASLERDALVYINFFVKTIFVVFGLAAVIKNWAVDLVECRRSCRAGIIGAAGVNVIFVMMNEVIFDGKVMPEILTIITLTIIAAISLLLSYWMLISNPDGFLRAIDQNNDIEKPQEKQIKIPDLVDQQWLEKLNLCMQQDFYYRKNELTIRILALHLVIPEHHLRRLINQHLGFRNFNDYVNRFRIKEASERLIDPANSRLPITTIAFESGYVSLTTFNKAFKDINEMTPSEFRRLA